MWSPRTAGQLSRLAAGMPAGVLALLVLLSTGCQRGPSLSKSEEQAPAWETPDLGPISEGLMVGALVDQAPIHTAVSADAPVVGYLHAGAQVARSEKSFENSDCVAGWYRIAPRGYVCTEKATTTDPNHPTLRAMALKPKLDGELPYVYARTTKVTALYEKTTDHGVQLSGRLAKSTVMAIVGSWTAPDESLEPQRLGLMMDGHFVRADDLEPAGASEFVGVDLRQGAELPVAFVVRRGVRMFDLSSTAQEKSQELGYHQTIPLTGRFRTLQDLRFWATADGHWVRHKDVTVVRRRHQFPDFAIEGQKWIDVSVVTGTLTAYEGKTPVYATLASVGRDRLGDPETTASTARGTFRVTEKHITRRIAQSEDESLHDAPWSLKLDSGQWLCASPRHDRFGIENTGGDIEVSPKDGAFLFHWSGPDVPAAWHGVVVDPAEATLIVHVRK